MYTATIDTMQLLDRLFEHRHLVPKSVVVREAERAGLGEDALLAVRDLPEGTYTHEGLIQQLEPAIESRVRSREAGFRDAPERGPASGAGRTHRGAASKRSPKRMSSP